MVIFDNFLKPLYAVKYLRITYILPILITIIVISIMENSVAQKYAVYTICGKIYFSRETVR